MKIFPALWVPLMLLVAACSLEDQNSPHDPIAIGDSNPTDDSGSTDTHTLPGDNEDTGKDTGRTDEDSSDTTTNATDNESTDTDSGDDGQITDTDTDSVEGDRGGPDLDTKREDGFGCDIPGGLLKPQTGETGYVIFDFGGVINDSAEESPLPGEGHFIIKLRGEVLPLSVESMTAHYSYTMPGVIIRGYSVPKPVTGEMVFLEAKIATADLIEMDSYGEEFVDIFSLPTGNSSPTNVRVYEGWRNQNGDIEQLCLSAVPGTTGKEDLFGLWPLWVCDTSINWMDNVGRDFGMAGNLAMFDDIDAIENASGMRCVCPNGAGFWRNCDAGTPEAYGLLKFNFKSGAGQGDWWSGYIYDEALLVDGENFNFDYANNKHPEGVWQNYWSPILGGLNIGARGIDPTDGHTIYRFSELLTPQNNVTVIGLVSKDNKNNRFVIRQHVFDANDASGDTTRGYWINAYLPGNITPGDNVKFGTGKGKAKLFVYDPGNSNCIQAVACDGDVRILETSAGLAASEGGKLHLKTELDAFDTRQSVQLWHPTQLPPDCVWETYLAESLQPKGIGICDKI